VEGLQCLSGQGHRVQHVCFVGIVVGGKPVAGGSKRKLLEYTVISV
jgi:hypothetical protein